MTVTAHRETMDFQAEVSQLLKLMIHSLYSNKEIFLRELISNASDACDKLRFEALTDDALYEGDSELKVRVSFDKAARTLTISANGIGMNRSEVTDHLGTIAKSGTKQFLESLSGDRAKDARRIGQVGVGFYSGFIVADRITGVTRRAGLGAEHGVRWESAGEGSYDIETVEKATRGTDVILHLREVRTSSSTTTDCVRSSANTPTTSRCPLSCAPRARTRTRPSTAPRPCGRGRRRRSAKTSTRNFINTSHTTSRTRSRTCIRMWKASSRIPRCFISRSARPSIFGIATSATASSSTCGACSSWTRRNSCCRTISASYAAWSIPMTCRSTSRAKSCSTTATSRPSAPPR